MDKIRCIECGNVLEGLVVDSSSGNLFCCGKRSPLEPGSCAFAYVEKNPEGFKDSYFFSRIEGGVDG